MPTHYILNQGFGVQTTFLYLKAMRGDLKVDFAINADTGDESIATYAHAERLKKMGGPPIVIRSTGRISNDLKSGRKSGRNSTGQRFASIPCYTTNRDYAKEAIARLKTEPHEAKAIMASFSETISPPGAEESDVELFEEEARAFSLGLQMRWAAECRDQKIDYLINQCHIWTQYGQTKRQCTKEYKTNVIETWIRRELLGLEPNARIPSDVKIIQYIGISMDEVGRSIRIRERFAKTPWAEVRFPLLEMQKTRDDCARWLLHEYNMIAPRSACVHCPYHDDIEWLRTREVPEDWELACDVDDSLRIPGNIVNRGARQKMYLHRSCIPLRDVDFSVPSRPLIWQRGLFQECEGMCGH